jgi:hypothetical protein
VSQQIVLFEFAGRQENLSIQWPFIERLLEQYPAMEVHLWDLTRQPEDAQYIRRLAAQHQRVTVLDHLHTGHPIACRYPNMRRRPRGYPPCKCLRHKPPYEQPYIWYADHISEYQDAVFVKIDDDVLFLETDKFDDLIEPLVDPDAGNPNRIVSGNIINNVVAAKYEPELAQTMTRLFNVGDPTNHRNDRRWWQLHTSGEFAKISHRWFFDNWQRLTNRGSIGIWERTRPGEAISINCIAFTFSTMQALAAAFEHDQRLGDEGVVDQRLPWIARSFYVGHLTFGPQDIELRGHEIAALRAEYERIQKEYLSR